MNVLRYEDIESELNEGRLINNSVVSSIQPASYDLRVGTIFRDGKIINQEHEEKDRQFSIRPGEIVSFFTMEEVQLPSDIAGLVFAMNRWSSEGLLVLNSGHIDPGYKGPLIVKAINLRKTTISVSRGDPIFTIVFLRMKNHTTHAYTKFEAVRSKERSFNAREQEIAPASLANLLTYSEDLPLVSEIQMDRAVRNHWMTRAAFGLTLVAAVAAVVGVALTVRNSQATGIRALPIAPTEGSHSVVPSPGRNTPPI
jgi:deoxycytidine triphosphate deaminase